MKIKELIIEAAADSAAREAASTELYGLFQTLRGAKPTFNGDISAAAKRAKELVKISGRSFRNWRVDGTDGQVYDYVLTALTRMQQAQGQSIPFPAGNGTAQSFKDQLALYFKGYRAEPRSFSARKWTMGSGGHHTDPTHGIEFNTPDERDAAMEEIEKHATKVYTRDPYDRNSVQTFYKIGKFLLSPSSRTMNPFSKNPYDEYYIMIQTTGIMRNPLTARVDMSDQQATALKDIAATKSANAMEKIQAITDLFKGEQDIKRIIANSQKINPRDKATLDAIIAGAKDFKER